MVSCPCNSAALVTRLIPRSRAACTIGHRFSGHRLVRARERFRHRKIERQLHKTEMMLCAADLAGDFRHRFERKIARRFGILAKRIPRGHAISANFPVSHRRFEEYKSVANPFSKFRSGHFGQLRLGVVQIEDVDGLDAEIPKAALHLVGEIFRRHAMASRCNFFRLKNAAIQKFAREILVRISRHFSVRRQESGFRAKHHFVARKPLRRELTQCRADRPLAALEAVIDGRIYYVDAAFHRRDHCVRVPLVCRFGSGSPR